MMQQIPAGWTTGDALRFSAVLDACLSYMIFDYARKIVAPSNAFLQSRQTDIGTLVLSLGQTFIAEWNTP